MVGVLAFRYMVLHRAELGGVDVQACDPLLLLQQTRGHLVVHSDTMALGQEMLNNVGIDQLRAIHYLLLEMHQEPEVQDLLCLTHLHWAGLVQLVSVAELESLWLS